jgi:hypothetical protein
MPQAANNVPIMKKIIKPITERIRVAGIDAIATFIMKPINDPNGISKSVITTRSGTLASSMIILLGLCYETIESF